MMMIYDGIQLICFLLFISYTYYLRRHLRLVRIKCWAKVRWNYNFFLIGARPPRLLLFTIPSQSQHKLILYLATWRDLFFQDDFRLVQQIALQAQPSTPPKKSLSQSTDKNKRQQPKLGLNIILLPQFFFISILAPDDR